ncbi:methylamine utilization protein MauE [Bailinhaonella thermotolerans]|uniref:Methylamine utilization protein MauE n=1 Tax=Bailinhaonella thermotolerans TaxID=1070861 RepID=A0A3A4A9M4_9ACTN|nr:methylamine utilization protein MauE [Bailinhaonella thermotolerans]
MQYLEPAIRCLLGVVFLVSSVSKVRNRASFEAFVASTRRLQPWGAALSRQVAVLVVAAEAAICALLAVGGRPAVTAGLVLAAGLLLAFTGGIALALHRKVDTSCRCFGRSETPLGPQHIVRNLLLTAFAAVGVAAAGATGPVEAGGAVVAVCAGLVVGGLVTVMDDIVQLFRPIPVQQARRPR